MAAIKKSIGEYLAALAVEGNMLRPFVKNIC
jgi:hypothetical protein